MKLIDISGLKFGRLTAVEISHMKGRYIMWRCICDCGNEKIVEGKPLRDGLTKSCGCLANEVRVQANITHGASGSPEYSAWNNMWTRCTNSESIGFEKYQHRTPPESWKSFENFFADMGLRPSVKHTLERIDNSLPYGPANCKWATRKEQNRNTSKNLLVIMDGIEMSFAEACEKSGLKYQPTYKRYVNSMDMFKASRGNFTYIEKAQS